MTRDDIIRMAREAGFTNPERFETDDENLRGILEDFWVNLERFAALVAAAEREACAQVCEELRFSELGPAPEAKRQRDLCAAAIRARGQA